MSNSIRTNDQWLLDLQAEDRVRDAAVADLRSILVSGLHKALYGWIKTGSSRFGPLVEDFAHDALLKIMDNLPSFRGESRFTTWAHKIAIRVALSELRRRRWKDVSLEQVLSSSDDDKEVSSRLVSDRLPTPDRAAEQADLIRRISRIIEEDLTEKQRLAMIAGPIKGVPIDVAAEKMGMTRNALYKLLHDARLKLKRRMAQEGLDPEDVLASFERS